MMMKNKESSSSSSSSSSGSNPDSNSNSTEVEDDRMIALVLSEEYANLDGAMARRLSDLAPLPVSRTHSLYLSLSLLLIFFFMSSSSLVGWLVGWFSTSRG